MWDNLIGRQIRRSTRNLLIWNSLILIALVVAVVFTADYWVNFFLGPFTLDRDTLMQMRDANMKEYFVTFEGDAAADSGYREIKNRHSRGRVIGQYEAAKYLLVDVGDKWLLVKVGMSDWTTEKRFTGTLADAPPEVRGNTVGRYIATRGNRVAPKPVLPVMLDATGFRLPGWIGLGGGIPLALLCAWNVLKAVRRLGNPHSHPLAKALVKYGDPEEVAAQIEEQSQADDVEVVAGITFTRSWLIRPTLFGVDLVHLGDAAWVYKTKTKHYTHGIPTGTTFAAVLCDVHGKALTVQISEKLCDDIAAAVVERVPWVLVGFDPELDRMWKKNKPQLYELVDARRQKFADRIRGEREEEADEPLDVEPAE